MLTSKVPVTPYAGFRASNLDDLVRVVESTLNARLLKAPRVVALDAFANACALPTSHLWFCSYGAPLTLQFAESNYVRVQFAHTGTGRTIIGSTATPVTTTQCCVSPADASIEFADSFQQVAWRIDQDVLTKKLVALIGVPITGTLNFVSALSMDSSRASGMSAILHCILVHVAQSNPAAPQFVLEELEQALIVSLLCNGEHNFRHLLDGAVPVAAPRHVRLVEEYIETNWEKPFRLEDMAAITGASVRSIYRAFKTSRGYSPMEFVKRQRLIQARSLLQNRHSVMTVTQVAFACGFSDVSRFSKDFSKAYGETPSAMRNRSKAER